MSTEQTQGSLTKEAIRLAWPAVCESFFIALAGMVDTFMVRSQCGGSGRADHTAEVPGTGNDRYLDGHSGGSGI